MATATVPAKTKPRPKLPPAVEEKEPRKTVPEKVGATKKKKKKTDECWLHYFEDTEDF